MIPLTTLDKPAPMLARLALLPDRDLLPFSGVRVPSELGACMGVGGAGKGNVVRLEMEQLGYGNAVDVTDRLFVVSSV